MARTAKVQKKADGDRLRIEMSSGYTLVIRRPSLNVIRAIQLKAEKMFPLPEPPAETIETVTGASYKIAQKNDAEYQRKLGESANKRAEYLLEYVFQNRLEVEGYETEDAQNELVEKYAAEAKEIREWGEVTEDLADLSDWQFTLRMFVVADGADYSALMLAATKAFDLNDITEDDIRQRITFL